MEREAMNRLISWKDSPDRKPLILKGARQVGKTWLMREFGKRCYENVVYLNFDEEEQLKSLFATNKNPQQLLPLLSLMSNTPIQPGKTLLIFDEVQECAEALNSLKYFHEQANEYHIVAAGSLLGTFLSAPKSYPVGQVNVLTLYPLDFAEFLAATDEALSVYYEQLAPNDEIPDLFHSRLLDTYHSYLIVGGMPECVHAWSQHNDPARVAQIQSELLSVYEHDFTKYNRRINAARILMVFRSIVPQLAKENEKFSYGVVKQGARAREFEEAVEWLISAGILHRIHNVSKPEHPLPAFAVQNHFKLFLFDVGLLKQMAGVDNEGIILETPYQFKGALTENFALQQMIGKVPTVPCYYAPGSTHEIDFLLQNKAQIIPVEVKAGQSRMAASFKRYLQKYAPKRAIRLSQRNYKQEEAFVNIPVYLAGRTDFLFAQK
ncbi:MAG: ATP-binding protein [Schwartzia sp.]|nr:ATP-binding protein [Schwartzia sp. (in: firmicutes)]